MYSNAGLYKPNIFGEEGFLVSFGMGWELLNFMWRLFYVVGAFFRGLACHR